MIIIRDKLGWVQLPNGQQRAADYGEYVEEVERLREALTISMVAMRIAKELPGVAAEYDFDHAIGKASSALRVDGQSMQDGET